MATKIVFETDGDFEVKFEALPDLGGAEFDIDSAELKIEIEAGNYIARST